MVSKTIWTEVVPTEGIRGVFNQKGIDEILRLTEKVLAA